MKNSGVGNDKPGAKSDPFSFLRDEVERAFESVSNWTAGLRGVTPRIDSSETEEGVEIEAELPGVDQTQIDVTLKGNILVIRGEKLPSKNESRRKSAISERAYGRFSRSVALPFEPDPNSVTANFRDGVLLVRIPKPEHLKPKPHKVPINP
jgi:HSP20 family protein